MRHDTGIMVQGIQNTTQLGYRNIAGLISGLLMATDSNFTPCQYGMRLPHASEMPYEKNSHTNLSGCNITRRHLAILL